MTEIIENHASEHGELVTILKSDYEKLCRDQILLNALQNGGVSNWEWYDASLEDHLPEGFYDD